MGMLDIIVFFGFIAAFVILPYFLRSGITTIPEFLEIRFDQDPFDHGIKFHFCARRALLPR